MERALILETTFLVDYEREVRRRRQGPATRYLEHREATQLYVTPTIAGELAAGESLSDHSRWREFLAPFGMLAIDDEVAWRYGAIYRQLRKRGEMIGALDLWIAATAIANDLPVVTRNAREFGRVPGLRVLGYS